MKNIEPIQIWKNGVEKQASFLVAKIVDDDLYSKCIFHYQLYEPNTITPSDIEGESDIITRGEMVVDGNINISETDYQNWDGSNDMAYIYIANQLNLTIQQ